MVLKNSKYSVTISHGLCYSYNSADNYPYDDIIEVFKPNDYYKTLLLYVNNPIEERKIGLISPAHTHTENIAILENNNLWLLLDYVLVLINLDNFELIRKIEITDSIPSFFELHKHHNDFIIYGEMVIIMLSRNFEEKWRFYGRDIFVRHGGGNAFIMKDDRICLYDFEDNYYEINYNGQLIL